MTAANRPGTGGREAWVLGAVVAVAAAFVHALLDPRTLVHSMSDEALLLPLGLRALDSGLYTGDRWLDAASQLFSIPYSYLMGSVMQVFAEPVTALRVVAVPFHAVFLAGAFRLARTLGGGRAAAYLTVAVLTLPVLLLEPRLAGALGPVLPRNHGVLASLVLAPGSALPRDLVFAFFPLACVSVLESTERTWWRTGVLSLLVGLSANLHPLTAAHMGALGVAAVWSLRRGVPATAIRMAGVAAVALVVGALPYIVQFVGVERGSEPAPFELVRWRIPGIGSETWTGWASRTEPLLWLAGAVVVASLGSRGGPADRSRHAWHWALGALAVASLGPVLAVAVEPLRQFQLDRLGRFAAVLLLVLLMVRLVRAWSEGRRWHAWLGAGLAAMLLVAPPLVRVVAGGGGKRGPLEAALRRIERGGPPTRPIPDGLVVRQTPGDPSRPRVEGADEAFRLVCAFVRRETGRGDTFLVPPEDFGAFRLHALRPTSVTRKEGGFALTFLRSAGTSWFAEYSDAARTYAEGSERDWRALADRYDARFVVADPGSAPPAAWPVVLDTGIYRVLRVP